MESLTQNGGSLFRFEHYLQFSNDLKIAAINETLTIWCWTPSPHCLYIHKLGHFDHFYPINTLKLYFIWMSTCLYGEWLECFYSHYETGVQISSWSNFQRWFFHIISLGRRAERTLQFGCVWKPYNGLTYPLWMELGGRSHCDWGCVYVLALFNPLIMQIMHFPRNYGPLSLIRA